MIEPEGKRNEVLGFIKQGLDDVSITRTSLDWGVPVPWAPGHVFYVWYDALINYATAVGFGVDDERFETWWPHVTHLIGKEIIRFHCVYWPAMLLAAGLEPPHRVQVHGWLLLGGEKLSKTVHGPAKLTDIAPARLVEDFGVDGYRYHFLRDVPLGPDSDFSYERMVDRYNADLANNLGNLLARVATVVGKKCGGVGPAPRPDSPLAAVAAEALRGDGEGVGRLPAVGRPRGDVAAGQGGQRPPRGERAVEGRAGAPRSTLCSATRSRPAHRGRARQPGHPRCQCRDLAPHRPPGHAARPAPPGGCGVGPVSRRPAGREGRAALPPHRAHLSPTFPWFTTSVPGAARRGAAALLLAATVVA